MDVHLIINLHSQSNLFYSESHTMYVFYLVTCKCILFQCIFYFILLFLESKLGSFWAKFLDAKKQLFVSERFLNSASEEGIQYTYQLVHRQPKSSLAGLPMTNFYICMF